MTKIKTQDLTGAALDWAVAYCEGIKVIRCGAGKSQYLAYIPKRSAYKKYSPSTNWVQGGPIIEREGISIEFDKAGFKDSWVAYKLGVPYEDTPESGPTPLIAAMRCYVASKLGDEIAVPGELHP